MNEFSLTLRCWATRTAGLDCPCAHRRPAIRCAPPAESQKSWLALTRLRRERRPGKNRKRLRGGVGMEEQPMLRFSLRCEAGHRLCFRDRTQHTLSVWSFLPHKFFSCRQLPASGTLRHGIYVRQCGVVCNPAAALSRRLLIRTSRSCGQSPRQFAGILHANAAAPP